MSYRNSIETCLLFLAASFFLLFVPPVAQAELEGAGSGLVAQYRFDEGSGTVASDASGGGNHAELGNSPAWITGAVGSHALSFDGVDDYANAPAPTALAGAAVFTIALWAVPAPLGSENRAFSIRNGTTDPNMLYLSLLDTTGGTGPRLVWTGTSLALKCNLTGLADGAFHHYVIVSRSSTDHEMFVDGVSCATSTVDKTLPSTLTHVTWGTRNGVTNFSAARIDDTRLYNRALSASEVGELYAMGSGGGVPPADAAPPVLSAGAPSGTLASGTTSATLSVTTSENATCKYGTVAGQSFNELPSAFATTGGTQHESPLGGLADGIGYIRYVRCQDGMGNANNSDYVVSFSIHSPPIGGGGNGGGSGGGAPPPPSGTVLYVDGALSAVCPGTYSIQARACAGTDGFGYPTIPEAVAVLEPGKTVAIRAGTYTHLPPINLSTSPFVVLSVSGTASQPIVLEGYGSERPVISGWGFEDRDLNSDGHADGPPTPSGNREILVLVTGDYVVVRNLELTNSYSGLVISGSNGLFENILVHDNWLGGVSLFANGKPVRGNLIRNIEVRNIRHGPGILLGISTSQVHFVENNTIENFLSYRNGYQPDQQKVLPIGGDPAGGGNSDGFVTSKECVLSASVLGVANLCVGNIVKGAILFGNADDGADLSFAGGSKILDSIAFSNGPEGMKGFKGFQHVDGISYIGNVSLDNLDRGFEPRFNGAGALYHNSALRNTNQGFLVAMLSGSAVNIYNNVSRRNGTNSFPPDGGGYSVKTNWGGTADPKLQNESFAVNTSLPVSGSIAERVAFIKNQFVLALSPLPGSPLIDAGTLIPALHCALAGPTPSGSSCRAWYGSAPDIGAYEYIIPLSNGSKSAPGTASGGGGGGGGGGGDVYSDTGEINSAIVSTTTVSDLARSSLMNHVLEKKIKGTIASTSPQFCPTHISSSPEDFPPLQALWDEARIIPVLRLLTVLNADEDSQNKVHCALRGYDIIVAHATSTSFSLSDVITFNSDDTDALPPDSTEFLVHTLHSTTSISVLVENDAPLFTERLSFGITANIVKELQKRLNELGYFLARTGVGSIGHETTFFGTRTDAALKRLQCDLLDVCAGTPDSTGYGVTGPRTRAILNGY